MAVADAVRAASCLELAGVEGYEGAINAPTLHEKIDAVDAYLRRVRELTEELARSGAFEGLDEIVVSAGGSNFFDRVVEILSSPWDVALPVRVVLRSGSYFTHDVDGYQRVSPLAERGGGADRLHPALELWTMVLSRPEPELAIANFGKRDVSYDLRLPIPFAVRRDGQTRCVEGQIEVTQLNDQHAFLRVDPDLDLRPGDPVGLGISHPCTAWDKWRLVPLVDDDYRVIGAIRTFF
jgi:D-serine deaminase-like pyridoxal phosphate-dependent protein